MKHKLILIMLISLIGIILASIKCIKNTKNLISKANKQNNYEMSIGGQMGISYNNGNNDRSALTFGTAGNLSRIPQNHPIITVLYII